MTYNKHNKERQDPEQRKRMNIDYYEVDATNTAGSSKYQTRFTSLSNIQKGFCWIEDIEYVSEIARQSKF